MTTDADDFPEILEQPLNEIAAVLEASSGELRMREVGIIKSITTGIARVSGPRAKAPSNPERAGR